MMVVCVSDKDESRGTGTGAAAKIMDHPEATCVRWSTPQVYRPKAEGRGKHHGPL
jgi:hypothetical protein